MLQVCRICLRAQRKGDLSVLRTRFSRLNDHIRRKHPGQNVSALTSIERNKTCRSKGQRGLFKCACGQVVVKKSQHLTSRTFHPELVGVPETASMYLKQFKAFKKLTYEDVRLVTETRPVDQESTEVELSEEEEEEEEELSTLMKKYVLGLTKNARVMKGRRDFKDVVAWAVWRQRRIGGGKDKDQVEKGKVMINRFLALIGYKEDTEVSKYLSHEENMETYDNYMIKTFYPGTVKSSYCCINNYLDFLLWSKKTSEEVHKTAKITVANLSRALKKDDPRRRKQLRRVEILSLPKDPTEVINHFRDSTYAIAIRQQWKNGNSSVWKEMRCIILLEMTIKNGTRCGEIRNLKYKHVRNARPFKDNPDFRTLVVDDHKTDWLYEATIHMPKELYKELVEFCTVTRKMIYGANISDELYVFKTNVRMVGKAIPHSIVNKWLKRAWKKAEMTTHYPMYQPSLTKNRKIVTSNVRRRNTHLAEDCAHMLCHSTRTADRHYNLIEQVDRSQETYQLMYQEDLRNAQQSTVQSTEARSKKLVHDTQQICYVRLERLPADVTSYNVRLGH